MLGWSTVALLGALVYGPAPPEPAVTLEWSAPASCPSAPQVQARLSRALADSAADPRGLRARATVTPDAAGGLTLVLILERDDEPAGQRTMQARDCDELATAAVLIVALAVDPAATLPPEEPEQPEPEPPVPDGSDDAPPGEVPRVPGEPPAPEPTLEPTPAPTPAPPGSAPPPDSAPPPEPEPEPAAPVRPRLHVGGRASAGAGLGVLPEPTAVLSLGALLWGRAWRAELGASYWTPVEAFPAGSTGGGRIQQWTVDARGCGRLQPGPLVLPLCGGVDVGAVHGRGIDVPASRQVASLRLALTGGTALVWAPARLQGRLGLRLGAEVLVALVRARFRASPAAPGLVYYTPPVGGRIDAGIEVRFR